MLKRDNNTRGQLDSDQSEQPTLQISSDFLTGSTEVGLERIRARLLDLTNRNRLLNYRHSTVSSLRIVNVDLDKLFLRLLDHEKIAFSPVPKRGPSAGSQAIQAKDTAEELGWNTTFELGEIEATSTKLPVLHYPEKFGEISRKIAGTAKTAIEESGTNMLYLVFGFLEWYESDDSEQPHLAPLVSLPVTMELAGKGGALETTLEYSGEDIETNLSLVEKMKREFGIEIPTLNDEDSPGSYFQKFAPILAVKERWAVKVNLTLTLLSFGKQLMYRDLDPKTWPVGESIAKHPLVRVLFEGTKNPTVTFAEEYAIDAPELEPHIPQLIRDADSSQHSALVQALRGQNLVIEGPPGTGKSQTITNLIAAALARGKTVLFVAEKLAAIEVVRSRLDEAGLGIFCLEVHSHKTKKGAMLNELAERIRMRGSFKHPRDLDRHILIVNEHKHFLIRYASLISKKIEPIGLTIFELIWARDKCGQAIADRLAHVAQIGLPIVLRYTQTHFTRAEQFLSVYTQHLVIVLAAYRTIHEHPWAWICTPQTFEEEQQICSHLIKFVATTKKVEELCSILQDATGITLARTLCEIGKGDEIITLLPKPEPAFAGSLLESCQSAGNRQTLQMFTSQVQSFREGFDSISACSTKPNLLLDERMSDKLDSACEDLKQLGLQNNSVEAVSTIHRAVLNFAITLARANSCFNEISTAFGIRSDANMPNANFLLKATRIVERVPYDLLKFRRTAFEDEGVRPIMELAHREAVALKATESTLGEKFNITQALGQYSSPRLLECAAILETSSLLQRVFRGDFRIAVKTYRRIAIGAAKASRKNMGSALRNIANHLHERSKFETSLPYIEVLGTHFQAQNTPWKNLFDLLNWYEEIFVALPGYDGRTEPFRNLLFTARTDHLKSIKANLDNHQEERVELANSIDGLVELGRTIPGLTPLFPTKSFDELQDWIQKLAKQLTQILQIFDESGIIQEIPILKVPSILSMSSECRRIAAMVQSSSQLPILIGDKYRGVYTDVDPIINAVRIAEVISNGVLPKKAVQWLLCPEYATRQKQLAHWLTDILSCKIALLTATQGLADLSKSPVWDDSTGADLGGLKSISERALESLVEFAQWNHFIRVRIESSEKGLAKLTTLVEIGILEPEKLVIAFRFVFYNTIVRNVFVQHEELSKVAGVTQEAVQKQFAAADRNAIRLYSECVAALIDQRPVPNGNQSGTVKTWSELALISHEISKQKRHIPIRQLMRRAATALVALKPCFMMGPMSVAQYLAPGQSKFDIVIMDEASQLKPEDAIGALARGGQMVIVGDPKQLPPTNFFQRVLNEEDEDGDDESRTAVEEGESILDVTSTLFQPVRRLRWHYRSRHQSLIAFSNAEFYQNDLVIFPSAYHDHPSLGVKHQFVADGVFENSRNPPEAEIVVNAVLEHMREHPDESLGVVTLNLQQREFVEELLDRRISLDPDALAFQEKWNGGPNEFFVKNLENVQGDERDVIFISTTYGPDVRGNQYQRFGPINSATGHRRLNVLFTRAKKRVFVISSIDPERIQTTETTSWGVRALKKYLQFARSGILQQPDQGGDQPANDFEESVGMVLKEHGYEVVPQVGVAGFFIDLAVKHPRRKGAFLLGIECDGASYHSGRSARDRDRLRQEILENLGWKIHRVWSTDWFKSRDSEIKRLLRKVGELVEADSEHNTR